MPALHTPERSPDESQADYRARLKASARVSRILETGPHQDPLPPTLANLPGAWRRFWLGQHCNETRAQRRLLKHTVGNRQWRRMVLKAYKLKAAKNAAA